MVDHDLGIKCRRDFIGNKEKHGSHATSFFSQFCVILIRKDMQTQTSFKTVHSILN